MAKTTNCAFCGKELTKGFFKGNDMSLEVGSVIYVTCCEDCHDKYQENAKSSRKRFAAKLNNYKRATKKKPSDKEIADMFKTYIEEEQQQLKKSGNEVVDIVIGCFCCNNNGFFAVRELEQGFGNSDVSAKDMLKTLNKADDVQSLPFDKNDITRIEFARVGIGDTLGLFKTVFSYEVRLNDQSIMTYKPCITRTAMIGQHFFPFLHKKSADKHMMEFLNSFKTIIGSDLPIVKVRKF